MLQSQYYYKTQTVKLYVNINLLEKVFLKCSVFTFALIPNLFVSHNDNFLFVTVQH